MICKKCKGHLSLICMGCQLQIEDLSVCLQIEDLYGMSRLQIEDLS